MSELLTWLAQYWVVLLAAAGSVVMGASLTVKALAPYTSTKKDDDMATFLDKVHKWLSKVALNPPVNPKQDPSLNPKLKK